MTEKHIPASTADEVERVIGWKPPVIYAIEEDAFRVATQADIDRMQAIIRSHGHVVMLLRKAIAEVESLYPRKPA